MVPVAGMALGACALVALAAAVWPRLGYGGEGEITYFGHVARFEGLEELIAGLDKVAPRHQSQSDHSAKRLLAFSRIIYDKYRYIRWGDDALRCVRAPVHGYSHSSLEQLVSISAKAMNGASLRRMSAVLLREAVRG